MDDGVHACALVNATSFNDENNQRSSPLFPLSFVREPYDEDNLEAEKPTKTTVSDKRVHTMTKRNWYLLNVKNFFVKTKIVRLEKNGFISKKTLNYAKRKTVPT